MSTLTPRPRSRRLQRLTPPDVQPLQSNMEMDDNHDWKLRSNVELKVGLKKLSKNDLGVLNCSPGSPSPKRKRGQIISGVKSRPKSKVQKSLPTVRKPTSTSKNIGDELRELLPRCDPNCKHCEEYILQLTQHIQSTHNPDECDDTEEQLFHSLISSVPEENDQESGPVSETLGDLDVDPSMTLTQDSNSDSQSESRTLVIRNTKVIYYVEELNENELGQIQTPLTSEDQPSTSTTFQNGLKNDSTEFEFVHVRNNEDVEINTEQVENFDGKMDVDPLTSNSTQNSDSDPEDADNDNDNENDTDPDFVGEESDQHSNSRINDAVKNEENSTKTNIFVCEICEKTFAQKAYVQKHMARAHASATVTVKTFTCKICNKNYSSLKLLSQHKKIHGRGLKHYTCKTCLTNYTDPQELKDHLKIHNDTEQKYQTNTKRSRIRTGEKSYKCETCGKTYNVPNKLAAHKRTHTGERPFKCTVCNSAFTSPGILSKHMLIHGVKSHVCEHEHCGKKFHRATELRNHLLLHTKVKEKTPKDIVCEVCHLNFVNNKALANHKTIHTEKSEICEYCGKSFHRKTDLRKHIRRVHTREVPVKIKQYKCDTCEKSYDAPGLLEVHKRTHTGEKPFMCEFCSMCFISSKTLGDHMKIHQEKSHKCEHCGETFHRARNLRDHLKVHTREKTYKCEDCEESFLIARQLELHQRIHTGEKVYKCEELDCGKYFPDKKHLTIHQKCHGEGQFQCTKCPKTFNFKNNLMLHLRIHDGIKPHKCENCGKCFTVPSKLKFHLERKTNCTPPEPEPVEIIGV